MQTARNTMGGTRPRNADDAYYTPDALALAICRRLRETIGEVDLIVEPSAGGGAFVRAARETWLGGVCPPIIAANDPQASDSLDSGASPASDGQRMRLVASGADSVRGLPWEDDRTMPSLEHSGATIILGNPPYLLAESHVHIALQRLGHFDAKEPQPRWLAFLLRASFLAGMRRVDGLWREAPPRYVWHVAPRPSFTGGGTDGAEYAVITWQAGWRGPYEGGWLRWQR